MSLTHAHTNMNDMVLMQQLLSATDDDKVIRGSMQELL